jgi:glyoxylase-like metal-dependent hydrolase (beta-lactamase superfamily II)
MRVHLLPSACGTPDPGPQFLSSYLVGEAVVIDGGSIGLQADLGLQRRVRHVFLTHDHLDHVASLPLLIDNTYEPGLDCVEVLAAADVLAAVRRNLLNDRAWPDFFALSTPTDRFVTSTPLEPFVTVERAGYRITPVPVSHATDTLAMVVDDGDACVAFAADTGPTELLWRHLTRLPNVRGVFLECSFPTALRDLATRCGHLAPPTFAAEAAKLASGVRVLVVHRKPAHAAVIRDELTALGLERLEFAVPGRPYEF